MPQNHELNAGPETVHWGIFDASLSPVLEVESGDTVTLHCISGTPEILPHGKFDILPEHLEVHERVQPEAVGHIMTGPVAIKGAMPGDVLEVRILDIKLRQDWGWNAIRPLLGALPDEFPDTRLLHIPFDRERMVAELPWGVDLPLNPFFGVLGVAPPPAWGRITSIIPRQHGGNMDIKDLMPGTTLYLPVFNPGAQFSAGDGHAAQGMARSVSRPLRRASRARSNSTFVRT